MKSFSVNSSNEPIHTASTKGIGFSCFVLYLIFIFLNPQNLFPAIKLLRPALFLSLFAFLAYFMKRRGLAIPSAFQNKLLMLLMGVAFLSTLFSINFDNSLSYLIIYLKALFLYLLFLMAADNEKTLKVIIWLMLIFAFIDAGTSLVLHKMGVFGYRLRSFDGQGGANDFAFMLLCMLPFAINFMENEDSRFKKGFSGVMILAFLLAITRTRSRLGFVGLAVLLAQFVWMKRKKPFIILMLMGLVIFTLFNTHYGYFQRVRSIDQQTVEHTRGRLWQQAIEMIKLRPLLGVGPGNYLEGKNYFNIQGDIEHVSHNSYLDLGAESGVIALSIYLLILIVSIRNILVVEKQFEKQGAFEALGISRAARIAYITLAIMMLGLSQQYNHFYFIFAAMSVMLKHQALKDEVEKTSNITN